MGTYGLEGVLREWQTGNLTTEQAIGQILLLLQELERRVAELEKIINPPPAAPKGRRRKMGGEA